MKKGKFTKEPLEVNLLNLVREDKLTDVVLPLIEPDMPCFTPFLEEVWDMIVTFS
jgi:hypothetical protein